jgi:acetylornithine deacetylase/succinyl-diaminopimelate desuccinylase-like protein
MTSGTPSAEDEVVDLCRDLIRFDTSNPTSTERPAAEYVAEKLAEVGLEPTYLESEPGRANVVARIPGDPATASGRGALLIHGHLDVVPARAEDWTVPPFAGEIRDGYLWGRGAIDMKDMDAMTLAVVRQWMREGRRPPRDVVVAFLADEEAGSVLGAEWLVEHHPGLFDGCTEAISEVGGFSVTVGDLRFYLIEAAEKGLAWMRVRARGRAGHGSMINDDNAVTKLTSAITRVGEYQFPLRPTNTTRAFLEAIAGELGIDLDPDDLEGAVAKLGPISRMIGAVLRNTANPTMLEAGYKCNVIPGLAEGAIDGRFLPGHEDEFLATIDELLGPEVEREWIVHAPALETDYAGDLVDAMAAALRAEDSAARPVPYMLSGGTDAKQFSKLGIRCFGFSPLKLPADLDFSALFHGVDERVPTDGLRFGTRVLDRFLSLS